MILVDTSIWIDLLGRKPVHRVSPDHQSLMATTSAARCSRGYGWVSDRSW